ncbi:MAG: aspartate aminotransferase family protein, partial [Blastocatellia bacterium]
GIVTLRRLRDKSTYDQLERTTKQLTDGLAQAARDEGITTHTNRVGSMWTSFFNDQPVTDWQTANQSDRELFGKFFHAMLAEGVYLAPSQFEAGFVSITHTPEIIDRTVTAAKNAFTKLKSQS